MEVINYLLFRTLILAKADLGNVEFGVEVQDSRTYLGDSGTPLSNSVANPFDVLQAYAAFDTQRPAWGARQQNPM